MSRSGYSEDCENLNLYRGTVARASAGKRGQKFFRDLVAALDALPEKRLIAGQVETTDGAVCALGALGRQRGADVKSIDVSDHDALGEAFGIARQLAAETMFENDDNGPVSWPRVAETPEARWSRVRKWAAEQIRPSADRSTP